MEGSLSGLVDPLVGVGAEEVALRLREVERQALGADRIIVGETGAHRENRDALRLRGLDDMAPAWLRFGDPRLEVVVEEQVRQRRILAEGVLDEIEELGAD